jgi:TrmH family RNA methyltransferase
MVSRTIRSRQNRRVKDMRALLRSKGGRSSDALAVLEGPHLVGEAIAAGLELEELLVTPDFLAREEGRRLLAGSSREATVVAPELLRDLTDADAPQGVLAAARLPRGGVTALPRRAGTYLFLDRVQDPGNLGALARVAEATGVVGLACSPGCAHPNHPRALRGSAGSLLRLPVAWGTTAREVAGHLEAAHPRWIALVAHGGDDLYEVDDLDGSLVLALGAEGGGLSAETETLSALRVRIPLTPPVESLNVATAGAVVLFELRRRALAARELGGQPAWAALSGSRPG